MTENNSDSNHIIYHDIGKAIINAARYHSGLLILGVIAFLLALELPKEYKTIAIILFFIIICVIFEISYYEKSKKYERAKKFFRKYIGYKAFYKESHRYIIFYHKYHSLIKKIKER